MRDLCLNNGFYFNGNTSKAAFICPTSRNLTNKKELSAYVWCKTIDGTGRQYALDTRGAGSVGSGAGIGFDKPSAYKSGAIVRCRKGNIWKDLKEDILEIIQEDESLYKWFKRKGTPGKEGGWVDCNAPDGDGGYKSCGKGSGEKRKRYPACRPTPGACKKMKGSKGKSWGKKDAKRKGKKK